MDSRGIPTGSPTAQLQAYAQSVYKMIKNRYFDDLTSTDGQTLLAGIVDWTNEFIDELETEINSDGDPIDWIWVRQVGATIGTVVYTDGITPGTMSFDTVNFNNLVAGEDRYLQFKDSNGNIIANFRVVAIDDLSNNTLRNTEDMCARVNDTLYFSRPFKQVENNATVLADVTGYIPRIQTVISGTTGQIVATNTDVFKTVKPLTLLKLGTVKNAILPDIVMGGLNPSYTQKYNDLLTNAINHSQASAVAPTAERDDLTMVHGVGF